MVQEFPSPFRSPSPNGLGRVLFERRGALFHALTACLVGAPGSVLVLVGLTLIVHKQGIGNLPPSVLVFGVGMVLGLAFLTYFGLEQYSLLRVHEGGIAKRSWGRTRSLLFEELDGFWFGGGHAYARGAYLGPSYFLIFNPAPDSGKRPLVFQLLSFRFTARHEYSDGELEQLRDWLYQRMSERMRQQLLAGKPVEWTSRLRFLHEGLEHRANRSVQIIPYSSIQRIGIDWQRGRWAFCTDAGPQPLFIEKMVRQPNDVAGLLLLESLRHGAADPQLTR